jgi:hypothetical protein
MRDLFAGLARRALLPRAIGPRLPSPYETMPAVGSAAWAPASALVTPGALNAPPAHAAAIATRATEALASTNAGPAAIRDAGNAQAAQPRDGSRAKLHPLGEVAPLTSSGPDDHAMTQGRWGSEVSHPVAGTPPRPDASVEFPGAAEDALAQAAGVQRAALDAMARLQTMAPLTPDLPPASRLPRRGEAPSTALRSDPEAEPDPVSAAGTRAQRWSDSLRQHAPQRLDDGHSLNALGSAPAAPLSAYGARAAAPMPVAAPRVDITIGSIDIVVSPAAAPAPRAAAAAGSVQSLDAYLHARQHRGGPR